jgi:putative tryptophan/tyrosine transport system substrate-binding protein
MRRRRFMALLGATATWPLTAGAQQAAIPVIGTLSVGSPPDSPDSDTFGAAFDRGLADRGFVLGKNVTREARWAGGNHDKLAELARELVNLKPALIVATGNAVAVAAKRATSTVPIVFVIASDAVKIGLAKSLALPGGNATGVSIQTATLTLKRLELIRELLPPRATVGLLVNPDNKDLLGEIEEIARSTRQSLEVVEARSPDDLEPAFAQLVRAQVGAVLVGNDAGFFAQRLQIVALAKRHSLPATYEFREFPAIGGLMSYGPNLTRALQKAGTYAALILRGARPSDLPIEQPTAFELVINLATARSLGIQISPSLLLRADEVIE